MNIFSHGVLENLSPLLVNVSSGGKTHAPYSPDLCKTPEQTLLPSLPQAKSYNCPGFGLVNKIQTSFNRKPNELKALHPGLSIKQNPGTAHCFLSMMCPWLCIEGLSWYLATENVLSRRPDIDVASIADIYQHMVPWQRTNTAVYARLSHNL